ncbi:response regulator transcription factor [Burkholderia pyrrocinia]|uniref:response regulator transcription factor n=1 Tax=Burkholderia pyrrocinia TaxID=60550 RepID=UPI00158D241C|nr:response regulator transcription factor [Burkholderia pyrrocinia]
MLQDDAIQVVPADMENSGEERNVSFPDVIDVVIADSHSVVLCGLERILGSDQSIRVVQAAASIGELMLILGRCHCDVLICNYTFQGDSEPDGMHLISRIRRIYPDIKVVVISSCNDIVIVRHVLRLGISGFIWKGSADFGGLPRVVRDVSGGRFCIDSETTQAILKNMLDVDRPGAPFVSIRLTPRELEVVRLVAKGLGISEIAHLTNRSIKTVSTQKRKAMAKLGAKNNVELLNSLREINIMKYDE